MSTVVITVDENSSQSAKDFAAAAAASALEAQLAKPIETITPADVPEGTGVRSWNAVEPGVYPNCDGIVIPASCFAIIKRDAAGAFSFTKTDLDTGKVNVSDVINNLTSIEEDKPLSAAQGKVLNEKSIPISKLDPSILTTTLNILDYRTVSTTPGYYAGGDDLIGTDSGFNSSDYVPVTSGSRYYFGYSTNSWTTLTINFYNSSHTYISSIVTAVRLGDTIASVVAPVDAVYLRVPVQMTILMTSWVIKSEVDAVMVSPYYMEDVRLDLAAGNAKINGDAIYGILPAAVKTDIYNDFSINDNSISLSKLDSSLQTAKSVNILDYRTVSDVSGYYGSGDTLIGVGSGFNSSDYTPVTSGSRYYFGYSTNSWTSLTVNFYTSSNIYISSINTAVRSGDTIASIVAPVNAAYLRVPVQMSNLMNSWVIESEIDAVMASPYYMEGIRLDLDEDNARINGNAIYGALSEETLALLLDLLGIGGGAAGKKWALLGDSITAGQSTVKTYWEFICEKNGIIGTNYGVGGSMLGGTLSSSMLARYDDMIADADIITVFGGTNDIYYDLPVGVMSDRVNTTFYGSLHLLCLGLQAKYPTKGIGFITPLNYRITPNGNGEYLLDFINAIIQVCGFYGIPVFDLYHSGGVSHNNAAQVISYYVDGVHPTILSHELMARRLNQFILSL
ncbi:MAG: SGNH/GDSL hydrolase family protein [Flavobacterium sp.]|nr:SGNH/GDSL hydrolase family protein [Flavobacterium sp.]